MSLTSRKKRPLNRNIPHLRDTKLIVVATEGKKTEKQYFDIFRNLKVQVQIIPSDNNRSAPEYVLERLDKYKEDYQIADDDELWLMTDVDRWRDRKLAEITRLCNQKGYNLAISNPCFEIWLFLHFSDIGEEIKNCSAVKILLRTHLGSYNSSNLDIEVFRPYVSKAVERAKHLHTNPNERFPSSIGSHVYKVIEKIA
jgi:hypothetical protein